MESVKTAKNDLNILREKLIAARNRLDAEQKFHAHHQKTSEELLERHKFLEQLLDEEVQDLEAQAVHVNAFGKAVLEWLNHSDLHR
tara:strand:+ start:383 stop:640 length:258 start_codon:yes stop_codon:yes gene_type:complete